VGQVQPAGVLGAHRDWSVRVEVRWEKLEARQWAGDKGAEVDHLGSKVAEPIKQQGFQPLDLLQHGNGCRRRHGRYPLPAEGGVNRTKRQVLTLTAITSSSLGGPSLKASSGSF